MSTADMILPPMTLLPSDPDAEAQLIGGCLSDETVWLQALDVVKPEHFTTHVYREAWKWAGARVVAGKTLDASSMLQAIVGKSPDARESMLNALDGVVGGANWRTYADRVHAASVRRALYLAGKAISEMCLPDSVDSVDALEFAQKSIFSIGDDPTTAPTTRLRDVVLDVLRQTSEGMDKPESDDRGIMLGLREIDDITGGFRPGQLVILAGRTGNGKTVLAAQLAQHAACTQKRHVLYVSLEMAKESLAYRILAGASGVALRKLEQPRHMSDIDFTRIESAANEVLDAPIHFADTSRGVTVTRIASIVRRAKMRGECDALVIDYLGLIDHGEAAKRGVSITYQYAETTRALKILSQECKIPVILLVQVNRSVDHRPDPMPLLADLSDSGSIEKDADLVLFTLIFDKFTKGPSRKDGEAAIKIAKNRQGRCATVNVTFRPDQFKFAPKEWSA